MTLKTNILLNTSKTQQHPFHVLHLYRLPAVMAALAGGLAISIVAKLQNIINFLTVSLKLLGTPEKMVSFK